MRERVKVRPLTRDEARQLVQIIRRGRGEATRYRRAVIVLASAAGSTVPAIARRVLTSPSTVRRTIHAFNHSGLEALRLHYAQGHASRFTAADIDYIATVATTRPKRLGRPFTRWSIRKLAAYLADNQVRVLLISRERLRVLLASRHITFQHTRTWKESTDPDIDAKLDRIEQVLNQHVDRTFAFDQFGPIAIRPQPGACWAARGRPDRLPATYHRTCGVRYLHGCYAVGDDQLWGVLRHHKGGAQTLAALKSIRAYRPDDQPLYVILDNLSANTTPQIRRWCARHHVELCLTPTNASWANPIEPQFGPLRQFTLANSDYANHVELAHDLHAYLRWRNAHARHPDVVAAQRRERAQIGRAHV
jgi:transposase